MSAIINILERIGQDSLLRRADDAQLQQALTGAGIDPELRKAILAGDQRALEKLLGAATNVCCGMHPPSPDDDEDEDDEPSEGDEKSLHPHIRRVAVK